MTLQDKIVRVARWIILESNEPVTDVMSLLDKIYRHRTTRINEDWGVLWEDDKTPGTEEM